MSKEPTKAELLEQISNMKAERREGPEDALIRAIAAIAANPLTAPGIKHLFYRTDGIGEMQISLDMHEVRP